MTITHPDQITKAHELESSRVMFPKGAHQMAAFVYAMESVPATERSVHAKMIDMMDDGWIEPFSVSGVNLSGLTTLEKRGECAGLRYQIEGLLAGDELHSVRAKFGNDDLRPTYDAVVALIGAVQDHLSSGRRRAARSFSYLGDLVWHSTCSPAGRQACTVCEVARRYGMSQNMVSRDAVEAQRVVARLNRSALGAVERKFADGVVLMLRK